VNKLFCCNGKVEWQCAMMKKVFPLADDTVPKTRKTIKNTPRWFPPVQHWEQKNQFVLKIMHDNCSLENEITTLQKLRNAQAQSLHIPELVWIHRSGELGILPIGEPVLPGLESAAVSCKLVCGIIDGLRYLHSQGIIHRDVRLSNLILKREWNDVNMVIIDYETAFDSEVNHSPGNEVDYSGGYICWLRWLLQSGVLEFYNHCYVPSGTTSKLGSFPYRAHVYAHHISFGFLYLYIHLLFGLVTSI